MDRGGRKQGYLALSFPVAHLAGLAAVHGSMLHGPRLRNVPYPYMHVRSPVMSRCISALMT